MAAVLYQSGWYFLAAGLSVVGAKSMLSILQEIETWQQNLAVHFELSSVLDNVSTGNLVHYSIALTLSIPHSVSLSLCPSDPCTLPQNAAAAHQHAGGCSHRWEGKPSSSFWTVPLKWTNTLVCFQSNRTNLMLHFLAFSRIFSRIWQSSTALHCIIPTSCKITSLHIR